MEAILIILAFIFLPVIVKAIKAAATAAEGKGSFSDAFNGMSGFEARMIDIRLGENNDGPPAKGIEAKGLFPVFQTANVGFVTSVFDATSGKYEPVFSAIETFQAPESIVYQHRTQVGRVSPDQGFIKWIDLGVVIPEILQPPISGDRELVVLFYMVDMDNLPSIKYGFVKPKHPGLLWVKKFEFSHTFTEKGYEEASADRDEAMAISIKIGMAVAMADGSLDDREGEVLKNWIVRAIEPFGEEKQQTLKQLYNTAMKEAYAEASSGDLSLSNLVNRLDEIAEKSIKYETIELCFDIMAADGVADAEEMKTIRKVAEALELDIDEIEKMRDQKIIGLDTNVSDHASIEDLLGIESDWEVAQIKKHLRAEFQKWNNRLNTLSEGNERENAQRMLDLIAEARRKYA